MANTNHSGMTGLEANEHARLAELRAMADADTGAVSALSCEMAVHSKINFAKRLRAAMEALRRIEANPEQARQIAAEALTNDKASI